VADWTIKKERIFLREIGRMSSHKGWSLYFGKTRVARYQKWGMALAHIQSFYDKFGELHPTDSGSVADS
jgi:hypothetical protein